MLINQQNLQHQQHYIPQYNTPQIYPYRQIYSQQQRKKQQILYKRIKKLGEGSFGKAFLVRCLTDNSLCVIKQMDLRTMLEKERKVTLKEAKILEALVHPNIIRFREVYKTKTGKLCLVMDYADDGDLGQLIEKQRKKNILLKENQILNWFTQICLAIKHCHDRKILHRDLKSYNIFMTKNGLIKLGDFGIAKILDNTKAVAKTMVGTPYYISPEIVENKPYSFKTDIWSLGVILYEMCTLKPPFNAINLPALAMRIIKGNYPPLPQQFSQEMKDLVKKLLNVDPSNRPSVHEILSSSVISKRIKGFLKESVRLREFSHTILHNQKLKIPKQLSINLIKNAPDGGKKSKLPKKTEKKPAQIPKILKKKQPFLQVDQPKSKSQRERQNPNQKKINKNPIKSNKKVIERIKKYKEKQKEKQARFDMYLPKTKQNSQKCKINSKQQENKP